MGARHMTFEELLKDEREEGREEGDKNRLVSQIRKKLEKGKTVEIIADEVEEDVDTVIEIINELKKCRSMLLNIRKYW